MATDSDWFDSFDLIRCTSCVCGIGNHLMLYCFFSLIETDKIKNCIFDVDAELKCVEVCGSVWKCVYAARL